MLARKAEYTIEINEKKHQLEAGYGFADRPYLNVDGEIVRFLSEN